MRDLCCGPVSATSVTWSCRRFEIPGRSVCFESVSSDNDGVTWYCGEIDLVNRDSFVGFLHQDKGAGNFGSS